jgi:urease accessory protein
MPHMQSQPKTRTIALRTLSGPILVLGAVESAWAHDAGGGMSGFASGLLHPMLGFDHLLAMVAVGIWASILGTRAVLRLPLLFLVLMAAGGALAMGGVPLPAVEAGIAASAVILGLVVAAALAPSPATAAVIVGGFAILHGHAHGSELPQATSALGYAAGFILATALLHLIGIGLGRLMRWPVGQLAVRTSGGAIALAGLAFLSGLA